MRIYLGHAKANYLSERDGYVNAMRVADYPETLYSFHYLEGAQALPIHENLRSRQHEPGMDERGVRRVPPSG